MSSRGGRSSARQRPPRKKWTGSDAADLHGRTAVVTGANTGLGLVTARMLAERGATVVLACRNIDKAADAKKAIQVKLPDAELAVVQLDLSSLDSVRRAASQLRADNPRIDLLINNAGTANQRRALTEDGFERTFATNHLGPFALTGLLLDRLVEASARVVTVSSSSHVHGEVDVDDLHFAKRPYRNYKVYSQSKLANLMFTFELQRKFAAAGAGAIAVAVHPGVASTDFNRNMGLFMRVLANPRLRLTQTSEMGALPTMRAAADPGVRGGDFYGPSAPHGLTGYPVRVGSAERFDFGDIQEQLWAESEKLTGVTYEIDESAV